MMYSTSNEKIATRWLHPVPLETYPNRIGPRTADAFPTSE